MECRNYSLNECLKKKKTVDDVGKLSRTPLTHANNNEVDTHTVFIGMRISHLMCARVCGLTGRNVVKVDFYRLSPLDFPFSHSH